MSRTVIHNAVVVNRGERFDGYVVIDGPFIQSVGRGELPADLLSGEDKIVDARKALLIPGAIDTHVHFREPGLTDKGTIASESRAAVAGGVTSFFDMPNTLPPTVSHKEIDAKREIAADSSVANYAFFIGATNDNLNEILSMDPQSVPGVKLFMGSSTGNMLVDQDASLERLFSEYKGIIAVHAEDEATIGANKNLLTSELGDTLPVCLHSLIRSREACVKATRRALELARRHQARLHLLHISTKEEVDLLRTVDKELVSAETCPHYLIFDVSRYHEDKGYLMKCNPAIKTSDDREALRNAIVDGTIDVIATDHAPHLLAQKQGSLLQAASGMPGTQFMLPLLFTIADEVDLTAEKIVELTAHNPATLYSIDRRGYVEPGYFADLVMVRQLPDDEAHTIEKADVMSACGWSPFENMPLKHIIEATYVNGQLVWNGREIVEERAAMPLIFNN